MEEVKVISSESGSESVVGEGVLQHCEQVRKRDGRIVDFDKTKIADAIFKAAQAVGGEDRMLADELAEAVTLYLRKKFGVQIPSIEEIQDIVEKVLIETGHAKTAKAYILYREKRAKVREKLRVRKKQISKADATDFSLLVTPFAKDEISGWQKAKIIHALMKEAGLEPALADEIASSVEQKIFESGISQISTTLIRELVDNELFERGLDAKLSRQTIIGMPTYDLEQIIYSKSCENSNINSNNPEAINLAIAENILKQYMLRNVFTEDVANAHLKGVVHIHDLGYPRVYCSSHSLEYLKKYGLELDNLDTSSAPASHARTLTGHLNTFLASLQAYYAGALGIGYINIFYAPYLEGMTYKEMKQEAQYLIFSGSQNAFSRGGQSLFIDFNIHTGIPRYLKNIPAIGRAGGYTGKTYGEYEETARTFTKAMLNVWQEGDCYGHPFAFPKCLDGDTKIFARINSKLGITTVKEAALLKTSNPFVNIQLPNFDFANRKLEWTNVTASAHRGGEIGIGLKLANNIEVKTTSDHIHFILTKDGIEKKMADQLMVGDVLLYKENITSILKSGENWKLGRHNYLCRQGLKTLPEELLLEEIIPVMIRQTDRVYVDSYALEVDNEQHSFIIADGIVTHNCDLHINRESFDDPKQYELLKYACEIASINGAPYFVFDRDEVTLSACCRLRTQIRDNYMIEHPESMRFCGFQNVTINLPQAAYRAGRGNIEGLYREIEYAMDIAVKAHLQKKAFIQDLMKEEGMPMWEVGKIAKDGRPYIDLNAATYIIGIIGLNECVQFLTGKELHESDEVYKLGLNIISYMFLKSRKEQEKHGLKFSLEESPAESATRRLSKVDLVHYPEYAHIVVKGNIEKDKPYYTNSVHFRADALLDFTTRIMKQSKFHTMIESGAIIHAFVGETRPSSESILNLVSKTYNHTQAAQLTISPEFTICNTCHKMQPGLKENCVHCDGQDVYGITRIVGYYSRVNNWNKSKLGELEDRQKGRYAVA